MGLDLYIDHVDAPYRWLGAAPLHHEPGKTRGLTLFWQVLARGLVAPDGSIQQVSTGGYPPVLEGKKVHAFAHQRVADLVALPWDTMSVPVESFVKVHEWLIWQATQRPPEWCLQLPARGHTVVDVSKMPEVLHETYPGFGHHTQYVAKVQSLRPVKEHFDVFAGSVLPTLQAMPNPDKLRAVFWLT